MLKCLNLTAIVPFAGIVKLDPGFCFSLDRLYFDPSWPLSSINSFVLSANVPFDIAVAIALPVATLLEAT